MPANKYKSNNVENLKMFMLSDEEKVMNSINYVNKALVKAI